ncbi:MAG: hypothetical protein MZU95_01660 [Desulfomicrobium escambiense]|nr:hypothetical protein [Desulfomicrobium escambiense]
MFHRRRRGRGAANIAVALGRGAAPGPDHRPSDVSPERVPRTWPAGNARLRHKAQRIAFRPERPVLGLPRLPGRHVRFHRLQSALRLAGGMAGPAAGRPGFRAAAGPAGGCPGSSSSSVWSAVPERS